MSEDEVVVIYPAFQLKKLCEVLTSLGLDPNLNY